MKWGRIGQILAQPSPQVSVVIAQLRSLPGGKKKKSHFFPLHLILTQVRISSSEKKPSSSPKQSICDEEEGGGGEREGGRRLNLAAN